jgi:TetR/AcrR family transcriptional regulator, lmrAB and yxaGH operons repressor
MVRSALRLIAERGVQGTSFADVLERSDAPRGSVYHHFPGGKDEMVTAAMNFMATEGRAAITSLQGRDARGVVTGFVDIWRRLLETQDFRVGCSVLGVTVTAETDAPREAAAHVFETWAADLQALLVDAGIEPPTAADFSWMLIAATEGAVAVARARRDLTVLDTVEAQLLALPALVTAQKTARSATRSDGAAKP